MQAKEAVLVVIRKNPRCSILQVTSIHRQMQQEKRLLLPFCLPSQSQMFHQRFSSPSLSSKIQVCALLAWHGLPVQSGLASQVCLLLLFSPCQLLGPTLSYTLYARPVHRRWSAEGSAYEALSRDFETFKTVLSVRTNPIWDCVLCSKFRLKSYLSMNFIPSGMF